LVRPIEQVEYGEETWNQMLEHVGFRNTVFTTHGIYPDSLMTNLAQAASVLIANGDSPADFTQFFGRCFVRFFSYHGYDKFIQVRPDQHPLPDARDRLMFSNKNVYYRHPDWCRL
jgi:guanylate cyclase, other